MGQISNPSQKCQMSFRNGLSKNVLIDWSVVLFSVDFGLVTCRFATTLFGNLSTGRKGF